MFRRAAAVAAALLLAACGAGGPGPGPSHPRAAAAAAGLDPANLIYVVPVAGAPGPARLVLADAIAAALRDLARPAVLSAEVNHAGASVVGRVAAVEPHGTLLWVTLEWQLRAPYGTPVARYRQQVAVDQNLWNRGGAEAVNLVVDDAARRMAEIIETHVGPAAAMARPTPSSPTPASAPTAVATTSAPVAAADTAAAPQTAAAAPTPAPPEAPPAEAEAEAEESLIERLVPDMDAEERRPGDARPEPPATVTTVQWGRPAFLIKPVTGAPGDGNEALTAALRSALRARDITISSDPRQAGFVIAGRVAVEGPVNGRQRARIEWRVDTITGEEVGKAVQENNVVAGTLDGEWGRVAEIVSNAAVQGIQELFGAAEKRLAGDTQLPDIPDVPLPAEPGRAPPPPASAGALPPAPENDLPPAPEGDLPPAPEDTQSSGW